MEFVQLTNQSSGCASYILGSRAAGACAVVDPGLNVKPYVDTARERGLRVAHIIETHAHADHVSGARKLAAATGAPIHTHPRFQPAYAAETLADGAEVRLGELALIAWHTPGHRPDGLSLLVVDSARAKEPWMVLTGDSLFVGDVGRPDLGQEPREAATQLHASLFGRLLTLPDWTEVYPAHIGGSPCGRDMSAKAGSTIGFERRFNPALQATSVQGFVDALTAHLPPQPPNFATMLRKNQGSLQLREPVSRGLQAQQVKGLRDRGSLLVDVRSPQAYGEGHIEESVNVPLRQGRFSATVGWTVPTEEPLVIVAERPEDAADAAEALASSGLDWVQGHLEGGMAAWRSAGLPLQFLPQMTVEKLKEGLPSPRGPLVVDVRSAGEWAASHIPGSVSIPLEEIDRRLGELDRARPVAFVCASGIKSGAVASKVKALGYDARNVAGGMGAWARARLPVDAAGKTPG